MKRVAAMVWALLIATWAAFIVLTPTPPEPTVEAQLTRDWEAVRTEILHLEESLRSLPKAKPWPEIPGPVRTRITSVEQRVISLVDRSHKQGWTLQQILAEVERIGWRQLDFTLTSLEPKLLELR